MHRNLIPILSTRKLSEGVMSHLIDLGFEVEAHDFISTLPVNSPAIKQLVHAAKLLPLVAIFTSTNAVESVAMISADVKPIWKIYCIGQATKVMAAKHFGIVNIVGTATNANTLAQLLVQSAPTGKFTFFCGDRRRDELPNMLRAHNIPVSEIVVYNTQLNPYLVTKPYGGILFYSPSTVQSFFINNSLLDRAVVFAIGHTTAEEIRKYSSSQIIISDRSSKEDLMKTMTSHFNSIDILQRTSNDTP